MGAFEVIASGEKDDEVRDRKTYWDRRLLGTKYDEVIFCGGTQGGVVVPRGWPVHG